MKKILLGIMFILIIQVAYAQTPTVLTDGLVAYWSFDDNITTEEIGNAGQLSVNGNPTSVAGIQGQGVDFDGTGDFLQVANQGFYDSGYDKSVMCWATSDEISGTMIPVSNGRACASTLAGFGWCWFDSAGIKTGQIDIGGDQANQLLTTGADVILEQSTGFHQYVMVLNGTSTVTEKLYWYANGQINDSDLVKDGFETSPSDLWTFGARADDTTLHYNGQLDECGVWNRSLTAAEINTLYNEGAGLSYSDIVALSTPITPAAEINTLNEWSNQVASMVTMVLVIALLAVFAQAVRRGRK